MINICIVAPFDYPIPAIKGGALEQVVENLCVENEKRECLNITVLATESKDIIKNN